MTMLARLAGTVALGAGIFVVCLGAAVYDDVAAKVRRARRWGELKI